MLALIQCTGALFEWHMLCMRCCSVHLNLAKWVRVYTMTASHNLPGRLHARYQLGMPLMASYASKP